MEDLNVKILWDGYGLRYYGSTRTRTGLVCKTDKGMRELKKVRTRQNTIRFAHDVKECLYHNGFTTITRFYPTTDGQPCYACEHNIYVLEEMLPAQSLEEDSVDSFVQGAEALGRLHRYGKGVQSEFAKWDNERLPSQFEKRRIELAKIKRRIQKQGSYDAIDLLVLQHFDLYMEQTKTGEALLRDAQYQKQGKRAEAEGAFCHRSFKGERLRLADNGQIYVGGFEGCGCDVPLLDLASYLKRYMKKIGGTQSGVASILESYRKNCSLNEKQIMLLQALVIYPEKFLRLTNEYYNKRRACVSPAMQERLTMAASEEDHSRKLAGYIRRIQ